MGYHVTILRTENGKQVSIPRPQVEAVLATRADLEFSATGEGALEITVRSKGDASPLLIWEDGEIWAKNPDSETLGLMIELAGALNARVRGDEFETYRVVGETYRHPDDLKAIEATKRNLRRAKVNDWIVRLGIVAAIMASGLLYGYCTRR